MGRVVGGEEAGEGVAVDEGDGLLEGVGDGDFFVAAKAASGAHKAMAAIQASRVLSLFFMVGFWVKSKSYRVRNEKAR